MSVLDKSVEMNAVALFWLLTVASAGAVMLPSFGDVVPNVTVTAGKDALLPCVVDNLGHFKVAWVRVDTQTILTIHTKVISRNPRVGLSHAANNHRHWILRLKNVESDDRGWYMCQINTDPMQHSKGYLEVLVPPNIVDRGTTGDEIVAKEGTNVSLACRATGHPEPNITWKKEDGSEFMYNGQQVTSVESDVLHLNRASRLHMGPYLCIASNGVPPSVSQRVSLKIQFPPMLWIPNQLEAAYIGQDVMLECHIEAYPKSINYWTTVKGDMIISGDKYEAVTSDDSYRVYMRLKIRNVSPIDFGTYKCVAKNSLGETDGIIKLYEIAPPFTPTPTTSQAAIMKNPTEPVRHSKKKEKGENNKKNRPVKKQQQMSQTVVNDVVEDSSQGESVLIDEGPDVTLVPSLSIDIDQSSRPSRSAASSSIHHNHYHHHPSQICLLAILIAASSLFH